MDDGTAPASATPAGDAAFVREVVRQANTSFLAGMRVLGGARRDAMYALYAFCRTVDDVADEGGAPEEKRTELAWWRAEVARLYAGRPSHAITRALLGPVRAYDLPEEEFLALVAGMETDAQPAIRGMTRPELSGYCRQVAGAVGMLSVRIFGDPSQAAADLAVAQGDALQLTNILRDVAEDAERDRLYLPHDLLDAHGIADREARRVVRDHALPQVLADLAAEAAAAFARVDALRLKVDANRHRAGRVMLEVYRALFHQLERRGWDRFAEPVRVPRWTKVGIAVRFGLL